MDFEQNKKITSIDLYNGTKVVFDAIEDKNNGRSHRVSATLFPRINITLRKVKGL